MTLEDPDRRMPDCQRTRIAYRGGHTFGDVPRTSTCSESDSFQGTLHPSPRVFSWPDGGKARQQDQRTLETPRTPSEVLNPASAKYLFVLCVR